MSPMLSGGPTPERRSREAVNDGFLLSSQAGKSTKMKKLTDIYKFSQFDMQ